MQRYLILTGSALALLATLGAGRLAAQPGGPGIGPTRQPSFSPYLNLNRSGTSAAVNYYGIVRPQFQAMNTFQSLEQQTAANRQAIADGGQAASGLPTTGHAVSFLNTGGYFMNLSGQGGAGGAYGGTGGSGLGGGGFGGGGSGGTGRGNANANMNTQNRPRR